MSLYGGPPTLDELGRVAAWLGVSASELIEQKKHATSDLPVRVPGATLTFETAFVALDAAFDALAGVRQSLVSLRGEDR